MEAQQPTEEQIILTVADQSKLDLVMELLSHFDLVRAERVRVARPAASEAGPVILSATQKAQLFLQSAGIWEGRAIDATAIRQNAWKRNNSVD